MTRLGSARRAWVRCGYATLRKARTPLQVFSFGKASRGPAPLGTLWLGWVRQRKAWTISKVFSGKAWYGHARPRSARHGFLFPMAGQGIALLGNVRQGWAARGKARVPCL